MIAAVKFAGGSINIAIGLLALFFLAGLILLRVADRIDQPAWQLEEL